MTQTLGAGVFAVLFSYAAFGQSAAKPPAFEVADVKASDPSVRMPGKGRRLPGGRIEMPGGSLVDMITLAYGVQEHMIAGAPKWASSDRFDIVAKASEDASMPMLAQMMQTLLAERF